MFGPIKSVYHLLVAVLSVLWFRSPARKLTVIGVTGTDGKTTTTTLIYEILKAHGYKTSMISSVHAEIAGKSYDTGFHVTTPSAFWVQKYLARAAAHGDTHVVLEVTSHGLGQYRVLGIPFTVGVITNVTHEHLDWHKTFERYLATKLSLLSRAAIAVINRDDAVVYHQALPLIRRKKVITYGIRRDAMVTPSKFPFQTKLPGVFNRYNCLAAISVGIALGIPAKTIKTAISEFNGVAGRMEVIATNPVQVIVDFAHTPNAIDKALKTARAMTRKRLIHVFGSAGLRDRSKRPLMGKSSGKYADSIILTEEDYRTENVEHIMDDIQSGIAGSAPVERVPQRDRAIAYALAQARPGDLVIITGKGHEQSLCRGKKEYPWSDKRAVLKVLDKKA